MVLVLILSGDSPPLQRPQPLWDLSEGGARHHFLGGVGGSEGGGGTHLKAFTPETFRWNNIGTSQSTFHTFLFSKCFNLPCTLTRAPGQSVRAWVSYQPHFTEEAEARGGEGAR